jgi:hypothetical protein
MIGCKFDFNVSDTDHPNTNYERCPAYFGGADVLLDGCRFFGMKIPNTGTSTGKTYITLKTTSSINSVVKVLNSVFNQITGEVSGTVSMDLIGTKYLDSGNGEIDFRGCKVEGETKTLLPNGNMIEISDSIKRINFSDNQLSGGVWSAPVFLAPVNNCEQIICRGNRLDFRVPATPIGGATITIQCQGNVEGDGTVVFADNLLDVMDVSGTYHVYIGDCHRAVIGNNSVTNHDATAPTDSIQTGNVALITLFGNQADDGITAVGTAQTRPDGVTINIGDCNIIT